ncbi:site-specific integrase [Fodinicurvata sediminis]|uniref:site-specific integrase n=1 Tax=Fodinicurvata sediminis TaxID=1121832 RepID=UPI0003B63302|nr:site-specific integrase [Fodinicurvata sediminis]
MDKTEVEQLREEIRAEMRSYLRKELRGILERSGVDVSKDSPEYQDVMEMSGEIAAKSEDRFYQHYSEMLRRRPYRIPFHIQQELSDLRQPGAAERALYETQENIKAMHAGLVDRMKDEIAEIPAPSGGRGQEEKESVPLLSEALEEYYAYQRVQLNNSKYIRYDAPKALSAFLEICGDRPLDDYYVADLREYVKALAHLPANYQKIRSFRGLSIAETSKKNASMKRPYQTISTSTIGRSYKNPVITAFKYMLPQHRLPPVFDGLSVRPPKSARQSPKRSALTPAEIVQILSYTVDHAKRRDDMWMMILGVFTGARIGELAYLQPRDLKLSEEGGSYYLYLSTLITVHDSEEERQLKTAQSVRRIPIHQTLVDAGFIDMVKRRKKSNWLFPHLHKQIKDPAATASKRMARLLDGAGIPKGQQKVFHSLRHSAKDWLRQHLDRRDVDVILGHAHESVAEEYGPDGIPEDRMHLMRDAPLPKKIAEVWPPLKPLR